MNKFFTRSALVSQLIPNPSEGKVRALFGTGKCSSTADSSNSHMTSNRNYKSMQSGALKEIGEYDTENMPSSVRFMDPKINNSNIAYQERQMIFNKLNEMNQ